MPFQKPRILTDSQINTIRGKCLVRAASAEELMQVFGHFDLIIIELQAALSPFADFYDVARTNKDHLDPDKVVAAVGQSAMAPVYYRDFERASELRDKY